MESIISLKKFNDEIEKQLAVLDACALRELIRSFASEIKPSDGESFLSKLSPSF